MAPKLGVMDEEYARTADDPDSVVGRKVRLARAGVEQPNGLVERIGDHLMQQLGL